MGDFDDFAAEARRNLDAIQQAEQEKVARDHELRVNAWTAKILTLETEVLPIMQEAKLAFERQRLRVEIKPNWSNQELYREPEVHFALFGNKKRSYDTSSYEIHGPLMVVARHMDGQLLIQLSTNPHGTALDQNFNGHSQDDLRQAIKRAAAAMFDVLAKPSI